MVNGGVVRISYNVSTLAVSVSTQFCLKLYILLNKIKSY